MTDDIKFDADEQFQFAYYNQVGTGRNNVLVDFLIKKGLANNKQQALYILIGIALLCLLVAFLLFNKAGGGKNINLSEEEVYQMDAELFNQ